MAEEMSASHKTEFSLLPFMQPPRRMETAGHKILLVEDNPSNLLIVSTFLESLGYEYDVAARGTEVLQKITMTPYALILMDVNIPKCAGWTTPRRRRKLKKRPDGPATLVIARTAHAMPRDRRNCLEAGMDDYISKPFSQEQLGKKLEQYICS